MAYKYGSRGQAFLFPAMIEDYVASGDMVRAYDAMLDSLDLAKLGIEISASKVGNSAYDPVSMLKLLVYGYSYGVRSSRKLERECHHNLSFIWLTGGLKPDHKTIAEFRRNNKTALKNVLKESARIGLKLGLIEGNTLFVDGSKIRANASVASSWDEQKCERALKKLSSRIDEILEECEQIDSSEVDLGSLIKLSDELHDKEILRSKIQTIATELTESDLKSINTTDSDSAVMHSKHGSFAGHNVQSVVDEKHGLIVNIDSTSQKNDYNQFSSQIEQAHETLGQECTTACADSGYSSTDDLATIDKKGIRVIVPSKRQSAKKKPQEFDKAKFQYNKEDDLYICPVGQILPFHAIDPRDQSRRYKAHPRACLACEHFGKCTTSKKGRMVTRIANEEIKERLETQYQKPESQAVYRLRKQKVELPFAHIKRNLKFDNFLMRGKSGVDAEACTVAACFNITRMVNLYGITAFISKISEIRATA